MSQSPIPASPRILVTGATGFVGGAIARHLRERGYVLRLAVRRPTPEVAAAEEAIVGDLAGNIDWSAALEEVDAVIHAAGMAHQPKAAPDRALFLVNAEATGRLAGAARRAGVRRFAVISSVRAVAGAWSAHEITDETPPVSTDAYGRSKRAGEEAALAEMPSAVILRPAAVCGAGAKGYFRLMARAAATGLPLPVGGFRGRRSYVSDRNLADAALTAIERDALMGRCFLVAEPAALTAAEFIMAMRNGLGAPTRIAPTPRILTHVLQRIPVLGAMIERLDRDLVIRATGLEALGWAPIEEGAAGLRRMAARFQTGSG